MADHSKNPVLLPVHSQHESRPIRLAVPVNIRKDGRIQRQGIGLMPHPGTDRKGGTGDAAFGRIKESHKTRVSIQPQSRSVHPVGQTPPPGVPQFRLVPGARRIDEVGPGLLVKSQPALQVQLGAQAGKRIVSMGIFPAVRQTVGVGIRCQRICPPFLFPAVVQSVRIRIGQARMGAQVIFLKVGQLVQIRVAVRAAISIAQERIQADGQFPRIGQAVRIRIRCIGVGFMSQDLDVIAQPIPIAVRVEWIRAVDEDFEAIVESVAVRVGIQGRGAVLLFLQIRQAIVVIVVFTVGRQGTQPVCQFPGVQQAIRIRIGRQGIRAVLLNLIAIAQFVAVGVGFPRIGFQFPFPSVDKTVLVGIGNPVVDLGQSVRIQGVPENADIVDLAQPERLHGVDMAAANAHFQLRAGIESIGDIGRNEPAFHEQPDARAVVRHRHVHPTAEACPAPLRGGNGRRGPVGGSGGTHQLILRPEIAQGKSRPGIGGVILSVGNHGGIIGGHSRILPDHRRHGKRGSRHHRFGQLPDGDVIITPVEEQRPTAAAGHPIAGDHVAQDTRPVAGNLIGNHAASAFIKRPARHQFPG